MATIFEPTAWSPLSLCLLSVGLLCSGATVWKLGNPQRRSQSAPPAPPPPLQDYSYKPPSNPSTNLLNWRFRASHGSHGRHEWIYLRTKEEQDAWPQTTEDRFWLGLETVRPSFPFLNEHGLTLMVLFCRERSEFSQAEKSCNPYGGCSEWVRVLQRDPVCRWTLEWRVRRPYVFDSWSVPDIVVPCHPVQTTDVCYVTPIQWEIRFDHFALCHQIRTSLRRTEA